MKRHGNLYDKITDPENIELAYKNAKKGKTHYWEVQEIEKNPKAYLNILRHLLITKTYRVSPYQIKIKNDKGKEREIYKLPFFPDRIIQWAIMQVIEPIFLKTFTAHTYSSIPKRGIHQCLTKLQ